MIIGGEWHWARGVSLRLLMHWMRSDEETYDFISLLAVSMVSLRNGMSRTHLGP